MGFKVVPNSSAVECQGVVCGILYTRRVVITPLSVTAAKFSVQCSINMEPLFHPFTHTPVALVNSTQ